MRHSPVLHPVPREAACLWPLVLGCAVATCDAPVGPVFPPAHLAVQPVLAQQVNLAAFNLAIDSIGIIVVRPPQQMVASSSVFFPPDASEIRLAVRIPMIAPVETFDVTVVLSGLGIELFRGTSPVTVEAGPPDPSQAPHEILVDFTGPGATVTNLVVEPVDSVLSFGASLPFRVSAFDAQGAAVPQFYAVWSVVGPQAATVNALGMVTAPATRDGAWVRAATPNGVADSTPVRFMPPPARLLGVDLPTVGLVGASLPFAVQVLADDGLPVEGVPVEFGAASGGGSVRDAIVVSDGDGLAATTVTLGTLPGDQLFEARIPREPGVTPLAAVVSALSGAISAATSVVSVSSGTIASGTLATLTLQARDAAGNALTTGGSIVKFIHSGGSSTGLIGPTIDHGDGTYSAPFTGLVAGTPTTIGATIDGNPVTSTLPTIDVIPGAVAEVLVTPATAALTALDATQQFAAQAFDANGNLISGAPISWSTSDALVAGIDPNTGLATALGLGVATIQATSSGVIGTATLTVSQLVSSVLVTPATATLTALGLTQQFTAQALDANDNLISGAPITWSTPDALVAGLDPTTGLATALGIGVATIQATSGGVIGTATLTVSQLVSSVLVSPGTAALTALDATQQFMAQVLDANGNLISGAPITWSTPDALVASIDPTTGVATALGIGVATIQAASGGVIGRATLTVSQVVSSVRVTPAEATLTALGATQQFTAEALDANGKPIPGVPITWSTPDALVAGIDPNTGLATALGLGVATIEATSGEVFGTATLTVDLVAASLALVQEPVGRGKTSP